MAVSGVWLLVAFFGILYALQRGVSSDVFLIVAALGALAFVITK